MKERPILFSGPMVRAILAGEKTQTRRIMAPQPEVSLVDPPGTLFYKAKGGHVRLHVGVAGCPFSPHGQVGNRLWVRETWQPWVPNEAEFGITYASNGKQVYHLQADHQDWMMPQAAARGWVPGIHMPRWASRIDLEIVNVRVERLQDISETDAQAEGVPVYSYNRETPDGTEVIVTSHRDSFQVLWNKINGDRATWESNPFVWVVEFKRVRP